MMSLFILCLISFFPVFLGILCLISFGVALIFSLGSGNYWVEVFNGYVGSVPLLIIAFFEIIGVIYIRGMKTQVFSPLSPSFLLNRSFDAAMLNVDICSLVFWQFQWWHLFNDWEEAQHLLESLLVGDQSIDAAGGVGRLRDRPSTEPSDISHMEPILCKQTEWKDTEEFICFLTYNLYVCKNNT